MDGDLRCGHRLGLKIILGITIASTISTNKAPLTGPSTRGDLRTGDLIEESSPKARRLRRGQRIRFTMSRTESWPPWLPGAIEPYPGELLILLFLLFDFAEQLYGACFLRFELQHVLQSLMTAWLSRHQR